MVKLKAKNNCPSCGQLLDGAAGITTEANVPSEGDLSICIYCGTLLTFDSGLNPVGLTPKRLNKIKAEDLNAYNMLMLAQDLVFAQIED